MSGLKSCPWCASARISLCETDYDGRKAYAYGCATRDCHGNIWALGYGLFETPEQAIVAWNTRLAHRDLAETVARLWGKGAKTHCHRGHPLTRQTIYFDKTGHRHGCILCAREKGRLRKMGITDAAVRLPIEDLQPLRNRKTFLIADRCRDLRQNS